MRYLNFLDAIYNVLIANISETKLQFFGYNIKCLNSKYI